ncbi:hypothetical protein FUSO7_00985 [Fusobacterium necrophorum BFTR-2]|uniref:major capsid protein n=1 Tax=Fusobacterium necrophorum TaxID=859 RepID=UPI000460C559|nr:major capsid protein [Fusobacterium necrophorum]KDE74806.1 hypothetical protein FUSO7_00985 [Fusobacterium necrophorum BFTR-2]
MYDIIALIEAIKKIKGPKLFLLNLFIGKIKEQPTAKFEVHTKSNGQVIAPIVGRRSAGTLVQGTGYEVTMYQPSMIKPYTIAEADKILKQQFGQNLYSNPQTNAAKQVAEELNYLKEVQSRTEQWMLTQLLITGILPQEEGKKGIQFTTNFRKEVLSGNNKWDHADADIISYLREQQDIIQEETGEIVDSLVVSPDVIKPLTNNPKIIDVQKRYNSNLIQVDPKKIGEGAKFIMHIPELDLNVYSFQDIYTTVENPEKTMKLLPKGTAILGKAGSFQKHYGAFPFKKDSLSADDAELFIGQAAIRKNAVIGSEDNQVELHSAPFIMPRDARGWLFAKVI